MGLLDISIIVLILISVLVGLLRGFTKELMSIAAWVISIYLAFNFYSYAAVYLSQYINNELFSNIAGGALIFVVSLFLLSLVGYLVSKAVAATGIKGTDRVLGAVLGVVRGVLIVGFFIVVASIFNVQNREFWQQSQLIHYFQPVADTINAVLPENFKLKPSAANDSQIIQGNIPALLPDSSTDSNSEETGEVPQENSQNQSNNN